MLFTKLGYLHGHKQRLDRGPMAGVAVYVLAAMLRAAQAHESGNSTGIRHSNVSLALQASPQPASSSPRSVPSAGTIAGVTIAVLVVAAICVASVCLWWRKRTEKKQQLEASATTVDGASAAKGAVKAVVKAAADVAAAVTARIKKRPAQLQVAFSQNVDVESANGPGSAQLAADSKLHTKYSPTPASSSASAAPSGKCAINFFSPSSQATSSSQSHEESVESMRIPWSNITLGRLLGEGGFGKVYKAKWRTMTVAVKLLNINKSGAAAAIGNLYREALIMSRLMHPCIARVFGVVDEAPQYALVMQYYPKGTLARYMLTTQFAELGLPVKLHIARQIAEGMCFMHERAAPILHGDLKAANILLTGPGRQIVIADFGLSQALLAGQKASVTSGALTHSISPPEVLNDPLAPRTSAADVYAYAVVLWEIFSGRPAFHGLRPVHIKRLVMGGLRPPLPTDMPSPIAAIIEACWAQEPSSRPSFAKIVSQLTACEDMQDTQYTNFGNSNMSGVDITQTLTNW